MVGSTGRNSNTNDEAVLSAPIALNATTSVKIQDVNERRIFWSVTNESNSKRVRIKFQLTSEDDENDRGIPLEPKGYYEMTSDNYYTGEISAITENGTANVTTTEY